MNEKAIRDRILALPRELRSAAWLAHSCHQGQVRKYTGEPYILHPLAVAETVLGLDWDDYRLARSEAARAALLHDVVEDCAFPLEAIEEHFGQQVCELVDWCTDRYIPANFPDLNRAKRKTAECTRWELIHPDAIPIKLADFLDNWPSIVQHDPGFAKVYAKEKAEALKVFETRLDTYGSHLKAHRSLLAPVRRALEVFEPCP